jgi:hypothetical protein|tara:strand:+ start:665 stop:1495 length:831 start_codon:yes stop_codon:yes gene_type:complete
MTLTRSVYTEDNTLLGVVALDLNLRKLKDILDVISNNLGRNSFPLLVTPQGDSIYHVLMTKYKQRALMNIGKDISNYEYFKDIGSDNSCACQTEWEYQGSTYAGCSKTLRFQETWCYVSDPSKCATAKSSLNRGEQRKWLACSPNNEVSFDTAVRPLLLRGETGKIKLRVLRALPAGDMGTEGFEGKEIDTTYFYRAVTGWDIRLALVIDAFDLEQTTLLPTGDFPRIITSQLEDYLNDPRNKALANQIPGIHFLNNENCRAVGSDIDFSNCKPDV